MWLIVFFILFWKKLFAQLILFALSNWLGRFKFKILVVYISETTLDFFSPKIFYIYILYLKIKLSSGLTGLITHTHTHTHTYTHTHIYIYIYIHTLALDRIMETPRNYLKNILILFSNCGPSVKSAFVSLPYSFWENWVLKMVIKLCYNFQSCILVILPNNPQKSPTVPIRQLSFSSRVLLQWRGFSFFLKCCLYFRGRTCYTKWFSGFCNIRACHTSTNNSTSFKVW